MLNNLNPLKNSFPFTRFWCESGSLIPLDNHGFMVDPESDWSHVYFDKPVKKNNQLLSTKCLLLLGEPGIGKSTELKHFRDVDTQEGKKTALFELRDYDSKDDLRLGIFNDEIIKGWLNDSNKPISIYLDSLDEALLEAKRISVGVFEIIKELNRHGEVFLRLACRTSDLPSDFDAQLESLYGESKSVLELTPLRGNDVKLAAKALNLDGDEFLKIIQNKELGVLASRPITLNMLLEEFQETHTVSENISDTYEKGSLFLLESSEQRIELKNDGELTAEQRLLIAERIATALMICNKSAIFIGLNSDATISDVHIDEINSGIEVALQNEDELNLTKAKIRETLDTALFKSLGKNRYSFVHQTFAEYLAARYLHRNKFTKALLYDIFVINDGVSEGLVPQLKEVALWASIYDEKFFKRLVDIDPELLLKNNLAGVDEQKSKQLLESLYKHVTERKIESRLNYKKFKFYRFLNFSGIIKFLKKKLRHRKTKNHSKLFLLDIISAIKLNELTNDLINVVLNKKEELDVRSYSLEVLCELEKSESKKKLLRLFDKKKETHNRLKAKALKCLYPDSIDSDLIVELLSENDTIQDSILSFSGYHILEHSNKKDLVTLLEWAGENFRKKGYPNDNYNSEFFWDEIILESIKKIDNRKLLNALSDYIYQKLEKRYAIFDAVQSERSLERFLAYETERKKIIETIVSKFTDLDIPPHRLYRYKRSGLIESEDFDWVIDHVRKPKNKNEEKIWAKILRRVFNIQNLDQIEALLSIKDIPSIQDSFNYWLNPIELDSEEALKARREYEEIGSMNTEEKPSINLPRLISMTLQKIESGESIEFINLDIYLSLNDGEITYTKHFDFDITNYPGWLNASEELKKRVIDSAIGFLENIAVPETIDFINNKITRTAYRSLVLVYNQDSSRVSAKLLEKWLHPIIYIELKKGTNTTPIFLSFRYQNFQQLTIEYIISLIKLEDSSSENPNISLLRNIQSILDFELAKNLFFLWKNHSLKIVTNNAIKECLIKFEYPGILVLVKSGLDSSNSEEYIFDAQLIATHFPESFFEIFWIEFKKETELSHKIIAKIAWEERHSHSFLGGLSENNLALLYTWLEKNYPHTNDVMASGVVTSEMQIADLRRYTLNNLVSRGSEEACNELLNIMSVFPEQEWIKYKHNEATQIYRRENWKPKSIEELLQTAIDMRETIWNLNLNKYGFGINLKALWKKYIR